MAYIARNGNNITLNLPIAFNGGDAATQNMMAGAIAQTWTGQFGQYNVTTNVINGATFPMSGLQTNTVNILPGNGMAQAGQVGGLSYTVGNKTGYWYATPSRPVGCLDYAHEGGHLMGLGEWNDSPNIMNQFNTTPEVTPALIDAILASPVNVILGH
jgi:hypothetical protein